MNIDDEIIKAYESESEERPPVAFPRFENKPKVTINLEEYTSLTMKSYALDRILDALEESFEYNPKGEEYEWQRTLVIDDTSRLIDTYRAFYPSDYNKILARLKSEDEEG